MLWIIYLAVVVLIVAAWWKIFQKAGEEGWKAIIPIWNILILLKIVGREWWWIILMLIPIVNLVDLDHRLDRPGEELRSRDRVRDRPDLPAVHLRPDPGLRRRHVPRSRRPGLRRRSVAGTFRDAESALLTHGCERLEALRDRDHRLVRESVEKRVHDPVRGLRRAEHDHVELGPVVVELVAATLDATHEVAAAGAPARCPSRSSGRPSTRSSRIWYVSRIALCSFSSLSM